MAYKLNLLDDSKLHPLFLISQLNGEAPEVVSAVYDSVTMEEVQPEAIMDQRIIDEAGQPVVEVLVEWKHMPTGKKLLGKSYLC